MSVNGNKFNTPMWDRNDEVLGCSALPDAPPSKVNARDETFCGNVRIEGNLIVEGDVIINGTLTVAGTITAPFFDGVAASATVADSLAGAVVPVPLGP